MSRSQADLELVLRARDLASGVVNDFGTALGGLGRTAERATSRVAGAFRSVSSGITNGLGNLTESLAQGAGLGEAMFAFGTYMAGQAAESLVGGLIEKLAGSSLIAVIGAPISAAGSALGGVMAAAVPLGMVALPALLLAAIVAAIVFLVNNPEVVDGILEFVGGVIDWIVKGLGALGGFLLDVFGKAWQLVVDAVGFYITTMVDYWLQLPGRLVAIGGMIVSTIIGGLVSLPGKVADVVRSAFASLRLDIGPFHISAQGVTIDLPSFGGDAAAKTIGKYGGGKARGGWVGMHGPELIRAGELGPELVIPANESRRMMAAGGPGGGGGQGGQGGGGGFYLEGVTERQVVDMVDRGLFFRLRRAPAQAGRV